MSLSKTAFDENIATTSKPNRKQKVCIGELNDTDIIMGRGKHSDSFPGNISLRRIIKPFKAEYACVQRKYKVEFAQAIIQKVMDMKPPGRFVERSATRSEGTPGDAAVYVEVDTERVIRKVLQALRQQTKVTAKKRKHRPKTKQVETAASTASQQCCPLALLRMLPETNSTISSPYSVLNTNNQFFPETEVIQSASILDHYLEYFTPALPLENGIYDHDDTMMADLLSGLQTCDYRHDLNGIRDNVTSGVETLDDNVSPSQMADAIVRDVMMTDGQPSGFRFFDNG